MKKNKQIIIGLVGQISSGKGAIAEYAQKKYNAASYRFSTILRDALDKLHIEKSRKNISIFSKIIRKNFGEDVLARAIAEDVKKDKHRVVVVDGIRRLVDIKYLKKLPDFKLIKIVVDPKIRYERLIKRNENAGDNKKTFKQFLADQQREAEAQVPAVMKKADLAIDNNGTWKEFYAQIEMMMKKLVK